MNHFPICAHCKFENLSQIEDNPKCSLSKNCQEVINNNQCDYYQTSEE